MTKPKRPPAPPRPEQRQQPQQGTRARMYLAALLLQYGAQPLLSKRCNGKEVVTSIVLACEAVKVICALLVLQLGGALSGFFATWSFHDALRLSALPAVLYAVQNSLLQLSYRNLDALTFSLLNQTKLASTAFFTYMLLRQKQSLQQVIALVLLLLAAACISFGQRSPQNGATGNPEQVVVLGIIPVLAASALSGLASTLCQWAAQVKKRDTYLMTIEMSTFGSIGLLASMLRSSDGEAIRMHGFFDGWTVYTLVPITTNAIGGILVGLVTTHSGGVKKGFVIVSALLVTALLQYVFDGIPPSPYVAIALPLVLISVMMHQKYPYKYKKND